MTVENTHLIIDLQLNRVILTTPHQKVMIRPLKRCNRPEYQEMIDLISSNPNMTITDIVHYTRNTMEVLPWNF